MSMHGQPASSDQREGADLRVHAISAISQVPAAEWDACANPAPHAADAPLPHRFKQAKSGTPLKLKE